MRQTWREITVSAACALLAGTAWAQGTKPLKTCPLDSVVSGTVCMDKYEASVWRVPNQTTTNKETPERTAIKAFVFLAALALITTTLLGITMAYRFTPSPVAVTLCLLAGILLPILLILVGNR